MVEPVTTAAAASSAGSAAGAVGNAASSIASSGGNFLSDILSIPGKIINGIGGAAKGVWNSLWSGITFTAVITGLKLLSPEGWRSAASAIGGEDYAQRMAAKVKEGGIGAVVMDSALQGFGAAGALGAAKGAFDGAGGGITGLAAGASVVGTVAAVVIGAMNAPATPPVPASQRTGETRAS
jgi:hypothetical protein